MRPTQSLLLAFSLLGGLSPLPILSDTIIVESFSGENIELAVNANDRFQDVMDQVYSCFQIDQTQEDQGSNESEEVTGVPCYCMHWNFTPSLAGVTIRAKQTDKQGRDYLVVPTKSEKDDIATIVRILAYESLWSIGNQKSSLKKMGDRVEHLHPFHFLMAVFTNEESKAGIAAIRNQIGWVRDGFFDPLVSSLKAEGERQNLLPNVEDFAKNIKIDHALITPFLKKGKHKEFVDFLIDNVPRANNPNRYNM